MKNKWTDTGCIRLREKIALGELTSANLVKDIISDIEALDRQIGAYLTLLKEQALQQATDIDTRIAQGQNVGQLADALTC